MTDILKLDDQIYIEEGYRKEHLDKAITLYELDKRDEVSSVRRISGDEESL